MDLAVVAETAPAKTLIEVIRNMDANVLSLTHSVGAYDLLKPYSYDIVSIGQSRSNLVNKSSNFKIGRLVLKDTFTTYNAMRKRHIDMVMTCGNAGDVRKGILAAKLLNLNTIHIEQDIYNPIEMIAYANIITAPDNSAKKNLKKMYGLDNVVNIKGYPQAAFVQETPLEPYDEIFKRYNTDDFYVLFLGGDTRVEDVPNIIGEVEKLDKKVLVLPFRFNPEYIRQFVTGDNIYIIEGHVDLLSIMNAAEAVIYCAGMGLTIEVGALSTPAIKLLGFHTKHASNDLAENLGINVVSAFDITDAIEDVKPPRGDLLVKNGYNAAIKVAQLTRDFNVFKNETGGISSFRKIWEERKKYR